jgi:phage terminase large subunit-like protein
MDGKGKKYILDFWEKRATPEIAIRKALYFAVKHNATLVRIESNQGGDTLLFMWDSIVDFSGLRDDRIPGVELVRATASTGSKMERASQMLLDYELNKMYHVDGEHRKSLEDALLRFPTRPPDDGVDACYWAWNALSESERWLT